MKNDNAVWENSTARWISRKESDGEIGLFLDFARPFESDGAAPPTLEITAVSNMQVYLNGTLVARGPAVADTAYRYFHRYELSPAYLRPGRNLLAVRLFHDGEKTETTQGFHYGKPGLLARLTLGDQIVVTDANWRVRRSPVFSPVASQFSKWGGYKEFYHGEREDDWRSPNFDHAEWENAVVCGEPLAPGYAENLVLLDVPELETEIFAPTRLIDVSHNLGQVHVPDSLTRLPAVWSETPITLEGGEPGAMPALTFDFGAVVVGYPQIALTPNVLVEVWYGETLDMQRTEVVRLPESGLWEAFHRRAYRYLKLVFPALDGPITLHSLRHQNVWYAYDRRATLMTSDPRLNHLLEITRRTQRANSSYHYEDCPVREQALWIMDMRVMSLVNYYLFGNPELTAKSLRQSFALQQSDGSIVSTGPKQNALFHPDFLMHLIAAVREYYQHTGDLALVAELLPRIRRIGAFFKTCRAEDGLLDSDRGQAVPFFDWNAQIQKSGKTTILNALYKRALEDMAWLECLCGDPGIAQENRADAEQVALAMNALLFDAEQGVYRDVWRAGHLLPIISQQANMAALYANIVPEERIAALLAKVWESDRYPRPFGPAFYLIVFEALARLGKYDAILETLQTYWGDMMDRGATTWWEVFDPTTPPSVYPHVFLGNVPTYECDWIPISACHGWSNVPGYVIPRYLLGVDLSHIHAGRVVIYPGLQHLWPQVDYAVAIGGGLLRLAFRGEGAGFSVTVLEAPEGIRVED